METPSPRPQRALDTLLGTDKHQRIRASQAGLAAVLMLACVGELNWLAAFGIADARYVGLWSFFSVAGLVVVFALIRSGYSKRWADPSLAMPQMLYAIACNAAAYIVAGQGRAVTLPLLAVILMFGMFGLSMRQVVSLAFYGLAVFGAAVLFVVQHPTTGEPLPLYGAYFFMVIIVLSSTTFLTWRLRQMREYMRRQKNQLSVALEKIQLIATRDELTATVNRRHMLDLMRLELQRSERSGTAFLIAMLDIDHFKRINDTYGHQAGDKALQAFTEAVQGAIRSSDTLARWGGEEFLVMLTGVNMALGLTCLARAHAKVGALVVQHEDAEIRFTVSIGVTQHRAGEILEQTIARADSAVYAAKAQGRDRVVSM